VLKYIAQAIAFGMSRLVAGGRRRPVSHENRVHAHWDRARREWVVRGDELDRAA